MAATVQIKQERHDEAEIREMAAKMSEQHKQHMAKQHQLQQQQQQNQQRFAMNQNTAVGVTGQSNIMNYLTRSQIPGQKATATQGSSAQPSTSRASGESDVGKSDGDAKTSDEESQKGHFGWVTFENGKVYIPYIFRQQEKYCAVRMVEMKLLNKYLNYLHQDIYCCTCVRSYYITENESRLLNEINQKHCDLQFGREQFTVKDLVVRLSDANKFYQFLDVCHRKLVNGSNTPNEKCGFIRINKESVVPYTIRSDNQKMVPLFYFEGETDNLKLKADYLSGWDLSYLKFCCKVQGIRNELFASDSVAVISLTDIKGYFPPGTTFEDYWPSKMVDSGLLLGPKATANSVHWTRQPAHPPPKVMSGVPQAKNNVVNMRKSVPIYQPNVAQNQQRMAPQAVSNQAGIVASIQALTNGWTVQQPSDVDILRQQQMLRIAQAQAQAQSQRNYSGLQGNNPNQMQNLLANSLYNPYNAQIARNSAPVPPPLVRAAHSQSAAAHMSQMAAAAYQQPNRNTNMVNGRQDSGSSSASSSHRGAVMQQQSKSEKYQLIPQPSPMTSNYSSYAAYKIQKAMIENQMVPCINMNAYSYNDLLITITDLKDLFFPASQSLDSCKKLLAALDIQLYKGNRMQYQAFQENGKFGCDGVPLVLVRDVMNHIPQLNYMTRNQELPANKRARIS